MKKTFLLIAALLCISASSVFAEVGYKLIVDDKVIKAEPISVNDRTLVPIRALMESTGADVKWDENTQGVDISRNSDNIHLQIDSDVMTVNNTSKTLDASPILYNGETTYVPLRAICEAFNFSVDWDENTKTVLINAPGGCPYVNTYQMTLREYFQQTDANADEFSDQTGLNIDDYYDLPMIMASESVAFSRMAVNNNMTSDELKKTLEIENISDDEAWGKAIGEAPIRAVISTLYGQPFSDDVFTSFKEYYGLGEEYSGDTKYKFMRTILDNTDIEKYIAEAAEQNNEEQNSMPTEEQLAEYEKQLPELCKNKTYFTITMQDGSVMKGEIYPDLAKDTAANFIKLCDEGFYNGLIFHRVINGFMIQGGGYDKDFEEKSTDTIQGEFYSNGYVNALKHERGIISMARTNDPNSASSQFFIMHAAGGFLDGNYAAFGKITSGLDVLDKIADVKTETNSLGFSDVPVEPIIIKSIKIDKR